MQEAQGKRRSSWIEKSSNLIVVGFFVLFFVVGLSIYKDYGLSWDENSQWKNIGYVNVDFISHHNSDALLNSGDKYHGPAFEIVLIGIEKLFKLSDSRTIFLMRHFVTFLIFFISTIFFYLLALKIFKDKTLVLIGTLFYVLSPHIFAHAFYNSKDSVFLSFFTISIYTLIVFYEKRTVFWAFLFAAVSAFTIDIRIMGIIIPLIVILFVLLETIGLFNNKSKQKHKEILFYFIFLIPMIILFWPVLWLSPIHHFVEAFKEAFYYHWDIDVFYFGKTYKSSELPWHYVPFWIGVSVPVLYSFLFLIGTLSLLKKGLTKPRIFLQSNQNQLIVLIWFFLPLLPIIFFKSIVFDTGRHLYFLHGGFVLISLFGLEAVYKKTKGKKIFYYFFNLILFFSLLGAVKRMIELHPYQQMYFNLFAGKDMNEIKKRFEMDYWGLSSREVLENILQKDSSERIKIFAENYPAKLNIKLFSEKQQKRIMYTDTAENANYFIADYRWHKGEDYLYQKEFYSVVVGNAKIMTAFKVRSGKELYYGVKGQNLLHAASDFEKKQEGWGNNLLLKPYTGAHSGSNATKVDSVSEYSDGLSIVATTKMCNKKNILLKTSFWKYDNQIGSKAKLVVSIEGADEKTYFWRAINETKTNSTVAWEKEIGAVELPKIKTETDKIKIYLWNLGKKQILIDDVVVDFIIESN